MKKRNLASGEPVVVSVYEKPHVVFVRELLLKLLREGADTPKAKDDDDESEEEEVQDTGIVEKIMVAFDGMIKKRYKIYANEFVEGVRAIMQELLNEVQELAPAEVDISGDGQAARSRLADIVKELAKSCE